MATIVSETNLVTRGECQETQKVIMQEFKEIKDILNKLPKQIMDEANDVFVRKDVYEANLNSLIEEVKYMRQESDKLQSSDSDRLFKIIQITISVIITLGMAYIAINK